MTPTRSAGDPARALRWPALDYAIWKDTYATLHLWTQVVGKIRLARTPWLNHAWHVPLYVTPRGLTTSTIAHERQSFAVDFDFVDHQLIVSLDDGSAARVALQPRTVADFHAAVMEALDRLGVPVSIHTMPNEIPDAIPFERDTVHRAYDRDAVDRFRRVLLQAHRVLFAFRTSFVGKCSPVHFFWGSFDLAVTRFSGRRAPLHQGTVPHLPQGVLREAYSHEVSSAGFWPGGPGVEYAAFYSYAYPEPPGFRDAPVQPRAAVYNTTLGEFLLPYDAVRNASDPDADLLAFVQSTYAAAASRGSWDRAALESEMGRVGVPRAID